MDIGLEGVKKSENRQYITVLASMDGKSEMRLAALPELEILSHSKRIHSAWGFLLSMRKYHHHAI